MEQRNLIDWKTYFAEESAAEALADPEEAAIRKKILDELYEKAQQYHAHINNYEYQQHCKAIEARGLRFRTISKKEAERKWDSFFAGELTSEDKRKIFYSQFKWHMFSYEKVAAKEGGGAGRAFDRCKKGAAYMFIQRTDEAWYIENAQLLTAADLSVDFSFERADVYIFDAEGKWAYVRTHESTCGPYFLRK